MHEISPSILELTSRFSFRGRLVGAKFICCEVWWEEETSSLGLVVGQLLRAHQLSRCCDRAKEEGHGHGVVILLRA